MEAKNFILDIAPLTRVSLRARQFFSYLSEEEISAGSLVSIPFSNRFIQGIVISSRPYTAQKTFFKLKKIGKVIQENFLTENQIRLANFAANYYLSPLGIMLKNFTPKITKQKSIKNKVSNIKYRKLVKLTAEQQTALDKIQNNSKFKIQNSKFLLYGPPSSGKTEIFLQLTQKLNDDEQSLILLPELLITLQTIERYENHYSEDDIAILHSKLSKGEFCKNWEKIRSGKARVIIGTRMAVFAPFKNLRLIGVEEEQDVSHKQWDMNPRYDARTLAEKLSEIYKSKLVFISATPRIETFYRAEKKEIELLKIGHLEKPETTVKIIDLRKEKAVYQRKKSLSQELISEMTFSLKWKNQIILFANRRGMSHFSQCQECKTILKCPKCDRALIYNESGNYRCFHCSFETDAFPKCPKCGSLVFKNFGQGNQAVEREIRDTFPSAKIKRVDFESMLKKGSYENLIKEFSEKKVDIIIGTQLSNKGWDLPGVGLIGIINADELLKFPDFNQDEKAFQFIVQASGRTGRFGRKFKSTAVIQTYDPENFVVKTASENDYKKFFEKEIEERKALKFPPFSKIIKLMFRDSKSEKVSKETESAFKDVNDISGRNGFKVQNAIEPIVPKLRGRFQKNIIIKLSAKEIPADLKKYLEKLGSGWIIDIDPISII